MKLFGINFEKYPTNYSTWINETLSDYIEITYKQGKGHFKIDAVNLLTVFNQTDFKQVVSIIADSENPAILAGYVNSLIKKLYIGFTNKLKDCDDAEKINKWLEKRNDILVKAFNVSPLNEEPQEEPKQEVSETTENITALKKCNVVRFIPTQIKPVWENGTIENHIGYHFEYRGMPLQAYTTDGWCKDNLMTTVFIIDPVLGLPITHFAGALKDIEDKLAEVFIGYLKTLESNKESIVQIATAFKKLKATA